MFARLPRVWSICIQWNDLPNRSGDFSALGGDSTFGGGHLPNVGNELPLDVVEFNTGGVNSPPVIAAM